MRTENKIIPRVKSFPVLYWAVMALIVAAVAYGVGILHEPQPNEYHNDSFSDKADAKGLTHTVIWATQDGKNINARIIVKNNTNKDVEYQPTYSLICADNNGNHYEIKDCKLKNTYIIRKGESNSLDCVFSIDTDEDSYRLAHSDFNSLKFNTLTKYDL